MSAHDDPPQNVMDEIVDGLVAEDEARLCGPWCEGICVFGCEMERLAKIRSGKSSGVKASDPVRVIPDSDNHDYLTGLHSTEGED